MGVGVEGGLDGGGGVVDADEGGVGPGDVKVGEELAAAAADVEDGVGGETAAGVDDALEGFESPEVALAMVFVHGGKGFLAGGVVRGEAEIGEKALHTTHALRVSKLNM